MKHDYAVTWAGTPRVLRRCAGTLMLSAALAVQAGVAGAEPRDIPSQRGRAGAVVADRHGPCSAPSRWRLIIRKVDPRTFGITYKVRGGAPDQQWIIFMEDNGVNFYNGERISGEDGFFRVRTSTKNRGGTDKFLVGANNSITGEICRSRASV